MSHINESWHIFMTQTGSSTHVSWATSARVYQCIKLARKPRILKTAFSILTILVGLCWPCSRFVAVCCSVLRCVAVCCSMLQCVAMFCRVLQCVAVCCSILQYVALRCILLQCIVVCRSALTSSILQCVAVWCSMLQSVAVCCNMLQCVAVCCSVGMFRSSFGRDVTHSHSSKAQQHATARTHTSSGIYSV